MKHKLLFFNLTILIFTLLSGCSTAPPSISKSDFYFDTVITITLYGTSDATYIDQCFALAADYEQKFSNTIIESEISKINSAAGKTAVEVSDDTLELLSAGIAYGEQSNGAFDITIGNLSDRWNFSEIANRSVNNNQQTDAANIPTQAELKSLIQHIDYHNISLQDNSVLLKDPDSKIDLGGIAKGYIADQMKQYLNQQGITSGIINLGGNVLTIGCKADNNYYTIGIKRPFDPNGKAIATVKVKDKSVVTSGVYERYFKVGQQLYHHILNPDTGYPYDNGLYSVTIISDSSMDGDALSTTCFALGLKEGLTFIEKLSDTEAIFITSDMQIYQSSGIGTTIPFSEIK